MQNQSAAAWAQESFGKACLKDIRRSRRLVAMAAAAARRPSGKVAAVFDRDEERAGAYDFLENPAIKADVIATVLFEATAERARESKTVFVLVDGTSLTLTDEAGKRALGRVGSPNRAARGLQVMNAFAVASDGVPLGLVDQIFWAREDLEVMPKNKRTERNQKRPFEEKECANFVRSAKNAIERLSKVNVRACIVIDREADNSDILFALGRLECDFIVRSKYDRRVAAPSTLTLRDSLKSAPLLGRHDVEIGRTGRRSARRASVELRSHRVEFDIRKGGTTSRESGRLELTAVSLMEVSSFEKDRLDWLLFTNLPVVSGPGAESIVDAYRNRWRIEEFHRTWKQGGCNVEEAQLHSFEALRKWTTILAAVATRIERLKYRSRNTPDAPASTELSADEIEMLKRDQRSRGVRKKRVVPSAPTIADVTRWIAELGGWIDQKGNGPPGSMTLGRGLERLSHLAAAHQARKSLKARR
ncbi:MAG: IS4 family transposase [Myxococcales bacterium]|nr:IS4 family transposase [Myxococcales bacterium]